MEPLKKRGDGHERVHENLEVVNMDNGVGNVNLVTSEGSDHASTACLICDCLLGLE